MVVAATSQTAVRLLTVLLSIGLCGKLRLGSSESAAARSSALPPQRSPTAVDALFSRSSLPSARLSVLQHVVQSKRSGLRVTFIAWLSFDDVVCFQAGTFWPSFPSYCTVPPLGDYRIMSLEHARRCGETHPSQQLKLTHATTSGFPLGGHL